MPLSTALGTCAELELGLVFRELGLSLSCVDGESESVLLQLVFYSRSEVRNVRGVRGSGPWSDGEGG